MSRRDNYNRRDGDKLQDLSSDNGSLVSSEQRRRGRSPGKAATNNNGNASKRSGGNNNSRQQFNYDDDEDEDVVSNDTDATGRRSKRKASSGKKDGGNSRGGGLSPRSTSTHDTNYDIPSSRKSQPYGNTSDDQHQQQGGHNSRRGGGKRSPSAQSDAARSDNTFRSVASTLNNNSRNTANNNTNKPRAVPPTARRRTVPPTAQQLSFEEDDEEEEEQHPTRRGGRRNTNRNRQQQQRSGTNTTRTQSMASTNNNFNGTHRTNGTYDNDAFGRSHNAGSGSRRRGTCTPPPVGGVSIARSSQPRRSSNNRNNNSNSNGDPFDGHESYDGRHPASVADDDDNGEGEDDFGNVTNDSDGCNGRLYDLLQTDPEVPAKEINRIFSKTVLRSQYREAYRVLSNPDKKRLYDIVGEPAVESLNKGWGDVVEVLGSTATTIIFGTMIFLTAILLLLFFVFLPVHVDRRSKAFNWHTVLIPLYILFTVGVLGSIAMCVISCFTSAKRSKLAFRHPAGRFIATAGYMAFVYLVGTALYDHSYPSKWVYYFIILIVVDCLTILEWMTWVYPRRMEKLFASFKVDNPDVSAGGGAASVGGMTKKSRVNEPLPSGGSRSSKPTSGVLYQSLVYGFILIGIMDFILAVLRYVFIGMKIDDDISMSWYGAVTPLALRFVTAALYRLHTSRVMHYIDQRTGWQVLFSFLGSLFVNSLPFVTTYLVAGYLEGDGTYDLVYAFIPIYFVVAYFFFASLFTAIYLYRKNRDFIALEAHEALQMRMREMGQMDDDDDGEDNGDDFDDPRKRGNGEDDDEESVYEEFSEYDEFGNRRVVLRKVKRGNRNIIKRRGGRGGDYDDDDDEHARINMGADGDDPNHYSAPRRRVRYGPDGEVIEGGEAMSDDDGSSSGNEVCISEATRDSPMEEEDHQPFSGGGRYSGGAARNRDRAVNASRGQDTTGVSTVSSAGFRSVNSR